MRLKLLSAIMVLMPVPAYAYIGPGAGLGAVITLIAIILGLGLLFVGFLWYPLKRFLKMRKAATKNKPKEPPKIDD